MILCYILFNRSFLNGRLNWIEYLLMSRIFVRIFVLYLSFHQKSINFIMIVTGIIMIMSYDSFTFYHDTHNFYHDTFVVTNFIMIVPLSYSITKTFFHFCDKIVSWYTWYTMIPYDTVSWYYHDTSWYYHMVSWDLMMHHDASWCIMMHHR